MQRELYTGISIILWLTNECLRETVNKMRHHFLRQVDRLPFTWWRHEIDTPSASLARVREIHWAQVDSLHKGPVMPSFDVSFVVSLHKLLNKQARHRCLSGHLTSLQCALQHQEWTRATPNYYWSHVDDFSFIIWGQHHKMCSRYQSLKYIWKLHFQNYCHIFPLIIELNTERYRRHPICYRGYRLTQGLPKRIWVNIPDGFFRQKIPIIINCLIINWNLVK